MPDEEKHDFVHAFITNSKDAVVWGFWHAAKAIYQKSQTSEVAPASQGHTLKDIVRSLLSRKGHVPQCEFAVNIKYGARNNALLLMYKGRKNEITSDEIRAIVGLDITKAPFTKQITARSKNEIEQMLHTLYNVMGMSSQISFATGDEIPSGYLDFVPPPAELHPSKWTKLVDTIEEISPPEFEVQKLPEKNPAVAWSQFANELSCAYCGQLNVASRWPPHGDIVTLYFQTQEDTEETLDAYKIKVHCPFCDKDWFVVWDEDPR